jgi:AraC-like DNA-binding protein/ligand-binding sensor protein
MNSNTTLVEQLANSDLFREYEKAFNTATGMPLALHTADSFALPFRGKRKENPFCAMMATKSKGAQEKAVIVKCAHGLSEAAVPVRLGDKVVCLVQTGQVFAEAPSSKKIDEVVAKARSLGVEDSAEIVRARYMDTPLVPREKLQSEVRMLGVFAELLSIKMNQIAVTESHAEHPVVLRAKEVIEKHQGEEISLGAVAKEVHVSSFHLCKLFRKSTGVTFTEYVSRTRTEKAKNLLLNPQLRISEIAYEVGFQSLTHFNRIFRKLVGESPTRYRIRSGARQAVKAHAAQPNRLRLFPQFV